MQQLFGSGEALSIKVGPTSAEARRATFLRLAALWALALAFPAVLFALSHHTFSWDLVTATWKESIVVFSLLAAVSVGVCWYEAVAHGKRAERIILRHRSLLIERRDGPQKLSYSSLRDVSVKYEPIILPRGYTYNPGKVTMALVDDSFSHTEITGRYEVIAATAAAIRHCAGIAGNTRVLGTEESDRDLRLRQWNSLHSFAPWMWLPLAALVAMLLGYPAYTEADRLLILARGAATAGTVSRCDTGWYEVYVEYGFYDGNGNRHDGTSYLPERPEGEITIRYIPDNPERNRAEGARMWSASLIAAAFCLLLTLWCLAEAYGYAPTLLRWRPVLVGPGKLPEDYLENKGKSAPPSLRSA